jgi:methyltransferase-like protein/2-polyprenyl-3-methyl-5-hydroxy-6-metoxy-1,4-benzoquinol methylase
MKPSICPTSYDQIAYPGYPYPATHPDLLAAIGILSGMEPPAIRSCRVLEVGCGDGSNIIPMAITLPDAEFVGIDLAEKPISQAQGIIDRTAITNISVKAMDLLKFTLDFGQFDYIIAHGFYSWVPTPLQEKLFRVCEQQLTPNGIAFISYNTYPAAYFRQACRDAMLFHLKTTGEPDDRVHQAKSVLELMVDSIEEKDTWKAVVRDELSRISKRDDNVIYHDELNEIYSPAYFADFIACAGRYGLQFLGEASLHETVPAPLRAELEQRLRQIVGDDLTAYHQYLDFIQFRGFRRTLLCRSAVSLRRDVQRERLPTLFLASPLRETSRKPDGKVTFKNQQGHGSVETDHSVMIAAIQRLARIWPRAESFEDLLQQVITRVPSEALADARSTLMEVVLLLISKTLVQCRTQDLPVPASVSNRPVASPLARLQAESGTVLTTLMHTNIEIEDPRTLEFLRLLDGSHDRRALAAWLRTGSPGISVDDMLKQVNNHLEEFRRLGLLVSDVNTKAESLVTTGS